MSAVVAEPKSGKAAKKATASPTQESRAARFRSKAFTREMTTAFHAAKLRALEATKAKA
ncbi:MAG: hypothetical protein WCS99_17415 [Limisphaerales bacterium]